MKAHINEWLIGNAKNIEAVQRQLVEHSYAGAYGGSIDLTAVNNLLGGAVLEITKLQNKIKELDGVTTENAKLQKRVEKLEGKKS